MPLGKTSKLLGILLVLGIFTGSATANTITEDRQLTDPSANNVITIDLDEDANQLVAATTAEQVYVYDTTDYSLTKSFSVTTTGFYPEHIEVENDVMAVLFSDGQLKTYEISTETELASTTVTSNANLGAQSLGISPDGSEVYVGTEPAIYDTSTLSVQHNMTSSFGNNPFHESGTWDGNNRIWGSEAGRIEKYFADNGTEQAENSDYIGSIESWSTDVKSDYSEVAAHFDNMVAFYDYDTLTYTTTSISSTDMGGVKFVDGTDLFVAGEATNNNLELYDRSGNILDSISYGSDINQVHYLESKNQVIYGTDSSFIGVANFNKAPSANFRYSPEYPESGESVEFNASRSNDPDGSISSYEWDFDDDGTYEATGQTISNTFSSSGQKNVTLKITDNDGGESTFTRQVEVAPILEVGLEDSGTMNIIDKNNDSSQTFSYDARDNGGAGEWNGKKAVIIQDSNNQLRMLKSDGTTESFGDTAGAGDFGDFDGDGEDEFLYEKGSGGSIQGTFMVDRNGTEIDTGADYIDYGQVIDYDNDGVTEFSNGQEIRDINGVETTSLGFYEAVGDYDNDGTLETITPDSDDNLNYRDLDGSNIVDTGYDAKFGITGGMIDIDNDGKLEVAFRNSNDKTAFGDIDGEVTIIETTNSYSPPLSAVQWDSDYVTDNAAPTADFSYSPASPGIGESISFDGTSSSDPDGDSLTYEWDWTSDGTYEGSGSQPSHSYGSSGSYDVTLRVSDGNGGTDTTTQTVTVTDQTNPSIDTSEPADGATVNTATPQINGSFSDNEDLSSYTLYVDSTQVDTGTLTGTSGSASYTTSSLSDGSHTYQWTVEDAAGNTNSVNNSFTVSTNSPPTASAAVNTSTVALNEVFEADGTGSSDSDGSISSYEWDWTSDGTYEATGSTATHSYSTPGTYTVTLRVTDDDGATDTDTVQVTAEDQTNPVASNLAPTGRITDNSPTISADASDNYELSSYTIDLDGTQVDTGSLTGTTDSISYTTSSLNDGQTYSYTVTVEDSGGNTGSQSETFTVNDAPTADYTYSPTYPAPTESVNFDASSSTDDDGITTYEWDFDDDGSYEATGQTASNSFSSDGDYPVTLQVTDTDGETTTTTKTVNVDGNNPSITNAEPAEGGTVLTQTPQINASFNDDHELSSYTLDVDGTQQDSGNLAGTSDSITYTTSQLSYGDHTYSLQVKDTAGNTQTLSRTFNVNDGQNPSIDSWNIDDQVGVVDDNRFKPGSSYTVSATVSDNTEVAEVTYTGAGASQQQLTDGDGDGTWTGTVMIDQSATDTTDIFTNFVAEDTSGNSDSSVNTRTDIDATPPSASFTSKMIADGTRINRDWFEVNLTASDNQALFNVTENFNGVETEITENGNGYYVANHTGLSPGDYTVSAEAFDTLFFSDSTASRTVTVNAAPTATFTFTPSSPDIGESISFDGSGSTDDDGINQYEWDWTSDGTYEATGSTATHSYSSAGSYDVTLRVTDTDGESSTTTNTVTVDDQTSPSINTGTVTDSTDGDGIVNSGDTVLIESNVTDNVAVNSVTADLFGQTYTLTDGDGDDIYDSSETVPTGQATGNKDLVINAEDGAGNTDSQTFTDVITVDESAPSITNTDASPDPVKQGETLTLSADIDEQTSSLDETKVEVFGQNHSLTQGSGTSYSTQISVEFDQTLQSYTATFFADDTVGNTATATETFNVEEGEFNIGTQTITSSGSGEFTYTPPEGTQEILFEINGAGGGTHTPGNPGGDGGFTEGILENVSSSDQIVVEKGEGGSISDSGTYGGGGSGDFGTDTGSGGGGTHVYLNPSSGSSSSGYAFGDRILVAGGGGGAADGQSGNPGGGNEGATLFSEYYGENGATDDGAGGGGYYGGFAEVTGGGHGGSAYIDGIITQGNTTTGAGSPEETDGSLTMKVERPDSTAPVMENTSVSVTDATISASFDSKDDQTDITSNNITLVETNTTVSGTSGSFTVPSSEEYTVRYQSSNDAGLTSTEKTTLTVKLPYNEIEVDENEELYIAEDDRLFKESSGAEIWSETLDSKIKDVELANNHIITNTQNNIYIFDKSGSQTSNVTSVNSYGLSTRDDLVTYSYNQDTTTIYRLDDSGSLNVETAAFFTNYNTDNVVDASVISRDQVVVSLVNDVYWMKDTDEDDEIDEKWAVAPASATDDIQFVEYYENLDHVTVVDTDQFTTLDPADGTTLEQSPHNGVTSDGYVAPYDTAGVISTDTWERYDWDGTDYTLNTNFTETKNNTINDVAYRGLNIYGVTEAGETFEDRYFNSSESNVNITNFELSQTVRVEAGTAVNATVETDGNRLVDRVEVDGQEIPANGTNKWRGDITVSEEEGNNTATAQVLAPDNTVIDKAEVEYETVKFIPLPAVAGAIILIIVTLLYLVYRRRESNEQKAARGEPL